MIPARKEAIFNAWFAGHARGRIHATFDKVWIHGISRARAIIAEAPILVVSNHTSWWDPLVVLHLSQHVLGTDGHALMDANNLRRLPFFALVGAFGVDLDRAADGAAAIRYAARLLDRPGRMVWVFPQGRERPVTLRPLGFRPGAAEIARVARRAAAIPAAFRYEFGEAERPSLFVSLGAPIEADRDVARGLAAQEAAVTAELDRIERAVLGEDREGFEEAFSARPSALGAIATAALAGITRAAGALRGGARDPKPPELTPRGGDRRDRR